MGRAIRQVSWASTSALLACWKLRAELTTHQARGAKRALSQGLPGSLGCWPLPGWLLTAPACGRGCCLLPCPHMAPRGLAEGRLAHSGTLLGSRGRETLARLPWASGLTFLCCTSVGARHGGALRACCLAALLLPRAAGRKLVLGKSVMGSRAIWQLVAWQGWSALCPCPAAVAPSCTG